jgi:hypothetical protein
MANYRVSTNTKTAIRQHRTKQTKTTKQIKMDQLRRIKLKHDLLKISVDLQTHLQQKHILLKGSG